MKEMQQLPESILFKTVDKNKAINLPYGIIWDNMVYYSTFQEKKKKLDGL